jgi:hypothetical protein
MEGYEFSFLHKFSFKETSEVLSNTLNIPMDSIVSKDDFFIQLEKTLLLEKMPLKAGILLQFLKKGCKILMDFVLINDIHKEFDGSCEAFSPDPKPHVRILPSSCLLTDNSRWALPLRNGF